MQSQDKSGSSGSGRYSEEKEIDLELTEDCFWLKYAKNSLFMWRKYVFVFL
jgi:hypothetical protein